MTVEACATDSEGLVSAGASQGLEVATWADSGAGCELGGSDPVGGSAGSDLVGGSTGASQVDGPRTAEGSAAADRGSAAADRGTAAAGRGTAAEGSVDTG